jgi:hypothetical protein
MRDMTQEQKDLLMKDICARLPYKVCAQIPDKYGGYTSAIESIGIDGFVKDFEGTQIEIENIKPYLFPMSSITEEQKEEYSNLLDDILDEFGHPAHFDTIESIDWLYEHHFDIHGLIPLCLAIDCTNLNIY